MSSSAGYLHLLQTAPKGHPLAKEGEIFHFDNPLLDVTRRTDRGVSAAFRATALAARIRILSLEKLSHVSGSGDENFVASFSHFEHF